MLSKYPNETQGGVSKAERKSGKWGVSRGLIVDTNITQIKKLLDGGVVEHPGSWRLVYQPKSQGSGFRFDLHFDGKEICLNEIVNPAWPIYPTVSGSRVLADEYGFDNGSQRWHITEINLRIEAFAHSPISIIEAFHELGHAIIYETILNAIKKKDKSVLMRLAHAFFPKTRFAEPELPELPDGSFGKEVSDAHHFFQKWLIQNKLGGLNSRLHERGAWAYALNAARKIGILDRFNCTEAREYYRSCLATYDEVVLEKAGAIARRK